MNGINSTKLAVGPGPPAYHVQTNWHVITGWACSGKTTLIKQLEEMGYQTVAETARIYIEQQIAKGRTFSDIYGKPDEQRILKELQRATESSLCPGDIVFLDRALPDSLAFYRLVGIDPNELLPECLNHRYASVFILDRLPMQLNGARVDDDDDASYMDKQLESDYRSLGYDVTRVPVLPPEERLDYVLTRLPSSARSP